MRGGATSFICLAYFAIGGCAETQTAGIEVRAIPDASAKLRPGSTLLADARAQLALNNVGLAIEGFRKALREQPDSAEAYAGLARCYEAMGRADLARTNYEAALALTPKDPQLLTAVAVALDRQGKADAAAMARQEAATISASSDPAARANDIAPEITIAPPVLSSTVTVALPAARPVEKLNASRVQMAAVEIAPVGDKVTGPPHVVAITAAPVSMPSVARPEVRIAAPALSSSITVALPPARPAKSLSVPRPALAAVQITSPPEPVDHQARAPEAPQMVALRPASLEPHAQIPAPALSSTVTVALPPAKPVKTLRAQRPAIALVLPPLPEPEKEQSRALVRTALSVPRGPYLERLSPGEVALVTDGRPAWRTQMAAQTRTSTTVGWVPIMTAQARPNIRVLNAAQRQGLAAGARTVLLDRGWRKIEIGNAGVVRERSLVLYPMSKQTLGRSLAAQFGFRAQASSEANVLVVLLGRDAQRTARPKRG